MAALPLPDGVADVAVALQSLAYVPDVARAIGEIARVLRPGGRAAALDTDFASVVWHGPRPGPRRPHPGGDQEPAVERVMGFCSEDQYQHFLEPVREVLSASQLVASRR